MPGPFDPIFDQLPAQLPIFPLAGAFLLPGGQLPLNIFEPRYLAMINHALAGNRLIGMIQPRDDDPTVKPGESPTQTVELQNVGCMGRITSFSETPDGRYLVTLTGLCRFRYVEDLDGPHDYRRAIIDLTPYRRDYEEVEIDAALRQRLLGTFRPYLERQGLTLDWEGVDEVSSHKLVAALAMVCPFSGTEKQMLLEAPDDTRRAEFLIALAALSGLEDDARQMRH